MRRAVEALAITPALCLVDGNRAPKDFSMPVKTLVGGDALSLSIAAASIIAKEHRDALMRELAEQHPHYGWESNAGYGTPAHLSGLKAHGLTVHHRRSFAPVRECLSLADAAA